MCKRHHFSFPLASEAGHIRFIFQIYTPQNVAAVLFFFLLFIYSRPNNYSDLIEEYGYDEYYNQKG